jgi:hypothetical protein
MLMRFEPYRVALMTSTAHTIPFGRHANRRRAGPSAGIDNQMIT